MTSAPRTKPEIVLIVVVTGIVVLIIHNDEWAGELLTHCIDLLLLSQVTMNNIILMQLYFEMCFTSNTLCLSIGNTMAIIFLRWWYDCAK